jgi:hypothetical protein
VNNFFDEWDAGQHQQMLLPFNKQMENGSAMTENGKTACKLFFKTSNARFFLAIRRR